MVFAASLQSVFNGLSNNNRDLTSKFQVNLGIDDWVSILVGCDRDFTTKTHKAWGFFSAKQSHNTHVFFPVKHRFHRHKDRGPMDGYPWDPLGTIKNQMVWIPRFTETTTVVKSFSVP